MAVGRQKACGSAPLWVDVDEPVQIMRVSQPLWPPLTVTASLHGWPNSARSYPVFGARPFAGREPNALIAGEEPPAVEVGVDVRLVGDCPGVPVTVEVAGDGVTVTALAVAVSVAVAVTVVVGSLEPEHDAHRALARRSVTAARNRLDMAEP